MRTNLQISVQFTQNYCLYCGTHPSSSEAASQPRLASNSQSFCFPSAGIVNTCSIFFMTSNDDHIALHVFSSPFNDTWATLKHQQKAPKFVFSIFTPQNQATTQDSEIIFLTFGTVSTLNEIEKQKLILLSKFTEVEYITL